MSLGRWAQRRCFYFAKFYFTFLHFLFFLIQFFHWWKIAWKGKIRVPLQEPYLIWYSSWGATLIYNIPGLDSAYVLVWYWKTSVKNKVHKNLPLFKQTNKQQQETPPEKVSSHWCWRLCVGLQDGQFISQCLSTRQYFALMSWISVRKSFHPTTNDLNLLSPSSPSLFISLNLQTDCETQLPPLMPAQF